MQHITTFWQRFLLAHLNKQKKSNNTQQKKQQQQEQQANEWMRKRITPKSSLPLSSETEGGDVSLIWATYKRCILYPMNTPTPTSRCAHCNLAGSFWIIQIFFSLLLPSRLDSVLWESTQCSALHALFGPISSQRVWLSLRFYKHGVEFLCGNLYKKHITINTR